MYHKFASLGAKTDLSDVEFGDYYSCYKTDSTIVGANGNIFVLT